MTLVRSEACLVLGQRSGASLCTFPARHAARAKEMRGPLAKSWLGPRLPACLPEAQMRLPRNPLAAVGRVCLLSRSKDMDKSEEMLTRRPLSAGPRVHTARHPRMRLADRT